MRDLLVSLVVFGGLPWVLVQPYVGVLLWSWIGYMNPHRLGWGFAYDFPFALLIGLATLVGLVFSRESKKVPLNAVVVLLIILNLWFLVTTYFAFYPNDAWQQWDKVAKIQLMVFVTMAAMRDKYRIHALVWVISLSLAFYGVKGGIFTILTGGQHMVWGPPGTFIAGNTEIALALVMTIPLLRYLQQSIANKWIRHGITICILLTSIAIIGSYSRGALLAVIAMAFFLWLKGKQKILTGMIAVVMLPAVLLFMPSKWQNRMHTIETYEEDASAMGRINAWWFAYNLAKDRPIVGGGFGAFDRNLFYVYAPTPEDFHDAHSIYFEVLGEQGFIGLTLFLAIGFMTWRTASKIIRQAQGHEELAWARDLVSMVQVSLVGFAVGGAFLGLAYFDLYYHLIAIVILTQSIVKEKLTLEKGFDHIGRPDHARSILQEMKTSV